MKVSVLLWKWEHLSVAGSAGFEAGCGGMPSSPQKVGKKTLFHSFWVLFCFGISALLKAGERETCSKGPGPLW